MPSSPKLARQRRKEARGPIKFVHPKEVIEPLYRIKMTMDVTHHIRRGKRIKAHFQANRIYHVDEETAVDFIAKGYATGKYPRKVSDDEIAERRAQVTKLVMPNG